MKDMLPAITAEIGKLVYFLVRAVPLLILMLVPGINLIASILWLAFGVWFMAVEYADYTMGNHGIVPKKQRQILRKQPLGALAFGAASSLLMIIPLVNLAAMPASVAGGTLYWVRNLSSEDLTD